MSEENGLQKASRWLGVGSSITLLEAKGPLDDPSYEEITIFPSTTDVENAYSAFFQSEPGAAWLLLKARLLTEEQTSLTLKGIEAYILAKK